MTSSAIQMVGFFALILEVSAVQWAKRSNILLVQLLANFFWVIHFTLLGAISGAVMNLVGAVRVYVFYRLGATHRPIWVLGLIVALVVLAGIATWQTWTSILPIFGIIVAVFAFWQLNEQRLRVLLLVAAPLWIAYNVLHGSYPGIINELLLIVSSLIALWRYRKLGLS